jgi:hypothetical protein
MIYDYNLKVSASQAVTASAGSTDCIDLGSARDIGVGCQKYFAITCDESATAAGAATVSFSLQCDDNSSFSSAKTVITSDAFAKTVLTAGRDPIYLPIPPGLNERYVRVYYTVATGPLTAGKFSAGVVHGIQASTSYPDAL